MLEQRNSKDPEGSLYLAPSFVMYGEIMLNGTPLVGFCEGCRMG